MKRLLTLLLRLGIALLLLAGVGAAIGAWAWREHVLLHPGPHIEREAILRIIAQESPVLYSDRQTRVGVFFAEEHREYLSWDELPPMWVKAIVAAEDQRFFEHHGVDPLGVARAMRDNLKAGRVVAGGSSLTQQTAKNLYYRPDRSARSKWEELVNALRLEAHHSKQEILEYYANQFHVSANGRGLAIAARYFFDKPVAELDLVECAFLAGMVKAPATYNPFIGQSEERRAEARQKAQQRTRYVLDRMLLTGAITAAQHQEAVAREIPFHRGTFRYDTHILLDEVEARLQEAPFPAVFEALGIDNPSTAGIQIVTTVHADLQRAATQALWSHLAEVGPMLEADFPGAAAFRAPAPESPMVPVRHPLRAGEFHLGRVTAVTDGKHPSLMLDLAGRECRVDASALKRGATILARVKKAQRGATGGEAEVAALLAALPAGSFTQVAVREEAQAGRSALCDLHLRPELQGALLILEDGLIRAMVGGNDNRNFNRATVARRQLGSTWKVPLYAAAMELGWLPTDLLDNRPDQVFVFEGSVYAPRADHKGERIVSLAAAAAKSENLATIWLLAHLLDRLKTEELLKLARAMDLAPRPGEARASWIGRIRDEGGVISTEARLPELAFQAERQLRVEELREQGQDLLAIELSALSHGALAGAVEARTRTEGARAAARFHFLRLRELAARCEEQARVLAEAAERGQAPRPGEVGLLSSRASGGRIELGCGQVAAGFAPVGASFFAAIEEGAALQIAPPEELWLDGRLPLSELRSLERQVARRELVLQGADPWSLDVLIHHPDFRLLLAMRTLSAFAGRLGVQAPLPPVLSMPLGAVEITLEEAATMYGAILSGELPRADGETLLPGIGGGASRQPALGTAPTTLIAEILDRDGRLLYRAKPDGARVLPPEVSRMSGELLRGVVTWGTGRAAREAVTVDGKVVPVAGKTGTTNSNRNVAFIGFVPTAQPGPDGPVWRAGRGFVVASYVGFDDNRPMRRGGASLQGASGALPPFVGAAQALARLGYLGAPVPEAPEWALHPEDARVRLRSADGLPDEAGEVEVAIPVDRGFFGEGATPRRVVALPSGREAAPFPTVEPAPTPGAAAPGSGAPGGLDEDARLSEAGAMEPVAPSPAPGNDAEAASPAGAGRAPGVETPAEIREWLGTHLDAPPEPGPRGEEPAGVDTAAAVVPWLGSTPTRGSPDASDPEP